MTSSVGPGDIAKYGTLTGHRTTTAKPMSNETPASTNGHFGSRRGARGAKSGSGSS